MRRLEPARQQYAWGSTSAIPELLGVADDGAPVGGCCGGTDDAGSCGSGAAVASEAGVAEDARPDTGTEGTVKPELRRRGAGTAEPANA